ncbi:MAG: hypothetical protein IPJ90_03215 [Anaerolineaceae bacterium]|nr:hypothetical protein [Anaerolineaceae bacterium]
MTLTTEKFSHYKKPSRLRPGSSYPCCPEKKESALRKFWAVAGVSLCHLRHKAKIADEFIAAGFAESGASFKQGEGFMEKRKMV